MGKLCFTNALLILVASLFLTSCGGGRRNEAQATNPLDETFEEGTLVLDGVQDNALNPTDLTLNFLLKTSSFNATPSEVRLVINEKTVDPSTLQVSADHIIASVKLQEGRNDVVFKAYDIVGRPIFLTKTIWAGSNVLVVKVVDANGTIVTDNVDLKLRLSDNPDVGMVAKSSGGNATFTNVPSRTVIVEAHGTDNSAGVAGGVGSDGALTIRLLKFNDVDATDNNDFSQGLAGYVYGTSPVQLVPHVEEVGPGQVLNAAAASMSHERISRQLTRYAATKPRFLATTAVQADANMDAELSTSGEGPQTMSRTFTVKPGKSRVSIRYRFVTEEVPGGFFGTKFNDYFSVTVRSKSGGAVTESNTMNGLGLAAFDVNGSTAWKTIQLRTDKAGDQVQVDFTVANVADDEVDSHLIIDFIDEKDEVVPALAWDPNAGGLKLTYKVGDKSLAAPVNIDVYWARGPTFSARIGGIITTVVVPAGTPAGAVDSKNIPGSLLQNDPVGTSHLISVVGEDTVGPVADVKIAYGPNADRSAVSAEMSDVVKDGLRSAGAKSGTISRTAVTPADQARAMFQNLVKSPGPLSTNISYQLGIYAPAGDAVIHVFESDTKGKTIDEAAADAASIQGDMVNEINKQGPSNVSKHCADPSKISVVDIPLTNFTSTGKAFFKSVASPRSRLLDENGVYHLEILRGP